MPARGDHSLRPSARVRGLNFCGRALKVLSTQSAIASGCGISSKDMATDRPSVAYCHVFDFFSYCYGDLGVDLMLRPKSRDRAGKMYDYGSDHHEGSITMVMSK